MYPLVIPSYEKLLQNKTNFYFLPGEAQYEQLRMRTLQQKTKYEDEINLMQNEIKTLIQENNEVKDQLKILQNVQQETGNLQTKLQESENVVQAKFLETKDFQAKLQEAENMSKANSSKYEQEIIILKEVIQEKENCMSDLRNSLDLLEKSREGLELDICNKKQELSERERNLLEEMQGMTTAFENEKTKILEDNFLEKEEMKKRVDSLEMLIHEYKLDTAEGHTDEKPWHFGGYRGVDRDNLTKKSIDARGYEGADRDISPEPWTEGINWDSLLKEHIDDRDAFGYEDLPPDNSPKTRNRVEKLADIRRYEGINLDRKATQGSGVEMQPADETVQYEEIDYYPSGNFKHRGEMQSGT